MEICGEYFKLPADKDLFAYFRDHYYHFFPKLSDRHSFVRQVAYLWRVKAIIWQRLVQQSGEGDDPIQVIDTLSLPICTYTSARRQRCFETLADYSFCAAKQLVYYGFKLTLRVSRCEMITHCPLLSARAHDVDHFETLVESFVGLVPADKGFIDYYRRTLLVQAQGVSVITLARARMAQTHPFALRKTCARIRKVVETVGSHLTERFNITGIRVPDLWPFNIVSYVRCWHIPSWSFSTYGLDATR